MELKNHKVILRDFIEPDIDELKDKLSSIIGDINLFEPIGNHNLKRHLVYKLSCANKKYVIKLYYKKNRWSREVASLKIFTNSNVLTPKIIDYGIFENGLEWMICDFIEGQLLSHASKDIPLDNLKQIFMMLEPWYSMQRLLSGNSQVFQWKGVLINLLNYNLN